MKKPENLQPTDIYTGGDTSPLTRRFPAERNLDLHSERRGATEAVTEIKSEGIIEGLAEALERGEPVRRKLPGKSQLQIDRELPFLFLYRQPPTREDAATERLIRAEASFLIAPGAKKHHAWVSGLVRAIVTRFTKEFGAFLLLEVSAHEKGETEFDADWHPYFRVVVPKNGPPSGTVDALEKHLRRVRIFQKGAHVDVVQITRLAPHGFATLLSAKDAKALNCSFLGLEILPVYRDAESGVFPIAVRSLRRQLSRALRRSVHRFCLSSTTHSPASYLAYGRRGLLKAVLDVDKRLSQISDSFDFLLHVTPVNVDAAWREFQKTRYEEPPRFVYRPLPVDPVLLKRTLFGIPMERIADPALEQLFRDKQLELDRKLTMFLDRGTNRFLYGSQQLYGTVSDELAVLAEEILRKIPAGKRSGSKDGHLNAEEFAQCASAELEHYHQLDPTFSSSVEIRGDVFSVMVSHGELLIGKNVSVPRSRVNALLQHEIGTHVLTHFNGKCQPLHILYNGLAGYDELQEGLAVLAEHLVGELTGSRLRILAARVIAARNLIDGASFIETYRDLCSKYRFERARAFNLTMRIYRGGGLTKDAVYLRGLVGILDYLKKDNSLDALLVGKVASPYFSVIHELQVRGVITPPRLRPRYLEFSESCDRLERVRNGSSVLDLVG